MSNGRDRKPNLYVSKTLIAQKGMDELDVIERLWIGEGQTKRQRRDRHAVEVVRITG